MSGPALMTFGEAVAVAREGSKIAREGWNGRGMWVRLVDLYSDREFRVHEQPASVGTWMPFLVMKTVDNALVPWLASQSDVLAHDWVEVVQ